MSDKGDVHPGIPVEFFLEGEDDGHPIHGFPDRLDPALPPGPHLGTDIVENLDAVLPGGAGEREVEIRVIDQDDEVGLLLRRAKPSDGA